MRPDVEFLSESIPSLMRKAATEDEEVLAYLERIYVSSKRRKSKGGWVVAE